MVFCENESNETVVLSSGSSKRGWEILNPQNYSLQQGFRTRSFPCLELFLDIYYCQFLVPRMQEWLSEQHRSFAAGLWLLYITMALECSKIYMNIGIRWEFYVQTFIYYVWCIFLCPTVHNFLFISLAIFVAYVSLKDHKSSGFTLCSVISID